MPLCSLKDGIWKWPGSFYFEGEAVSVLSLPICFFLFPSAVQQCPGRGVSVQTVSVQTEQASSRIMSSRSPCPRPTTQPVVCPERGVTCVTLMGTSSPTRLVVVKCRLDCWRRNGELGLFRTRGGWRFSGCFFITHCKRVFPQYQFVISIIYHWQNRPLGPTVYAVTYVTQPTERRKVYNGQDGYDQEKVYRSNSDWILCWPQTFSLFHWHSLRV